MLDRTQIDFNQKNKKLRQLVIEIKFSLDAQKLFVGWDTIQGGIEIRSLLT
jgi:hypothetical protein